MKTLKNFPNDFYPLVVVVGDRREFRPITIGDILAYSVSTTDLIYLNKLGLRSDTLIISDKIFLLENEEKLKEKYGKCNILTIGSPAVNLFSRMINEQSLFKFNIEENAKIEMQEQNEIVKNFKFDQNALQFYKAILEQGVDTPEDYKKIRPEVSIDDIKEKFYLIKGLIGKTKIINLRGLLRQYMGNAILDPIVNHKIDMKNPKTQGLITYQHIDFGFVSLAIHPYCKNDDYSVIYVAGRHGPGTSHSLRALTMHQQFEKYPYGCVIEVHINLADSYSDRFQNVDLQWPSDHYIESPTGSFRSIFYSKQAKETVSIFHSMPYRKDDPKWIKLDGTIKKFLEAYYLDRGKDLIFKSPYKEKIGEWDFTDGILQFFPKADFIIHNITDLSAGVMFEMGCSFGLQKPIFAYKFTDNDDERIDYSTLPKFLQNIQIIEFSKQFRNNHKKHYHLLDDMQVKNSCPGKTDDVEICPHFDNAKSSYVSNKDVFIVISPKLPKLSKIVKSKVLKFGFIPKTIENYKLSSNLICKYCEGITNCKYLIADISENYSEGIISLGMGKVKNKLTLGLLNSTSKECSMYRGINIRWTDETLEDNIDEALTSLLS